MIVSGEGTQPYVLCVLSHSVVSDSLGPLGYSPPGSSVHGISPGKNTGVGCHFLLQWIFPTQGLNRVSVSPALGGGFFTTSATWEAPAIYIHIFNGLNFDNSFPNTELYLLLLG